MTVTSTGWTLNTWSSRALGEKSRHANPRPEKSGWFCVATTPTAEVIQPCVASPARGVTHQPDLNSRGREDLPSPKLDEGTRCYNWNASLLICVITSLVRWSCLPLNVFLTAGRRPSPSAFKFTNQSAATPWVFSRAWFDLKSPTRFPPRDTFCNRVIKVFIWLHPL